MSIFCSGLEHLGLHEITTLCTKILTYLYYSKATMIISRCTTLVELIRLSDLFILTLSHYESSELRVCKNQHLHIITKPCKLQARSDCFKLLDDKVPPS